MQRCNYNSFLRNIDSSWRELRQHSRKDTKGSDGLSIADFISNEKFLLNKLKSRLKSGSFCFSLLRPVRIDDGKREILIATVDDRIVAKALLKTVLPKLKHYSTKSSYCPVVKASKPSALPLGVPYVVQEIQRAFSMGHYHVFETDIIDFFGTINKKKLLSIIRSKISDPKVFNLIKGIISFEKWNCNPEDYSDEFGIAQGSALSPLFAAIYLYDFDRKIEEFSDVKLIRYVDDLVVLCNNHERAAEMSVIVETKLERLGLQIHPLGKEVKKRIKTNIKDVSREPLDFLGLTFNLKDVTIAGKKMKGSIDEIRYILNDPKQTLLKKVNRVRNKIAGCIEQYKPRQIPCYRTKDQLNSLIRESQRVIDHYYHQVHRGILKQPPFLKVSEGQKKQFKKVIGLDVTELLLK